MDVNMVNCLTAIRIRIDYQTKTVVGNAEFLRGITGRLNTPAQKCRVITI
jgi:hypothetical protein